MPIHLAITRRVRAGREAEFEQAIREFFVTSLAQDGVMSVQLLSPLPGSGSQEYGILRTFASEGDRAAFYQSPTFQAWERKVQPMTDGLPRYRQLHGMEAWFRPHSAPPRWKMAALTFLGVYATTLPLTFLFGPYLRTFPLPLGNAAFNLMVVPLLTWVVMPSVTRLFAKWLHTT